MPNDEPQRLGLLARLVVVSILALIVAGMFLGAGIMRLWINHATDVPSNSLAVLVLRVLTKIVL